MRALAGSVTVAQIPGYFGGIFWNRGILEIGISGIRAFWAKISCKTEPRKGKPKKPGLVALVLLPPVSASCLLSNTTKGRKLARWE